MPHACNNHRQSVLFAVINGILVANRASGLNECGDAGLMSELHAIIEWEECITRHHSADSIETDLLCLFHRLPERIASAGLATSFSNQLPVLHHRAGVRLEMLANEVREHSILLLLFRAFPASGFGPF